MRTERTERPSETARRLEIRWPTAVVLIVAIITVAVVYAFVPDHRAEIGLGVAGAFTILLAFMRRVLGLAPPVLVLLMAAAIAIPVQGCGAGALRAHARASSILVVALQGADELADTGAEIALGACGDDACEDRVVEATEAIDAGIAAAALPAGAYVQAVQLAVAGGEDTDVVMALVVVLARALAAWDDLVPLFATLGVELPQLPTSLRALVGLIGPPDPGDSGGAS